MALYHRQLTGTYPAGYIPAGGLGGGGSNPNIDYSGWVGQGEGNYMQADGSYGPTPSWEQPAPSYHQPVITPTTINRYESMFYK